MLNHEFFLQGTIVDTPKLNAQHTLVFKLCSLESPNTFTSEYIINIAGYKESLLGTYKKGDLVVAMGKLFWDKRNKKLPVLVGGRIFKIDSSIFNLEGLDARVL